MGKTTTGNGATLTFGTQGGSYLLKSIAGHEESRAKLDDSDLSTTGFAETAPGDLTELSDQAVKMIFRSTEDLPSFAAAETLTITFPLKSLVTPASIAGTGYVVKRKYPDLENGKLLEAEFMIVFDGKTGPTFTAESS